MQVSDIIARALDDHELSSEQLAALFETPLFTKESALILAAGRHKAEQATAGKAEVHAQVGVNIARCPRNCKFCSFAACNELFEQESELSPEDIVAAALRAEAAGANAVYLMITANYPFGKFVEIGAEVRRALRPETPLVGNLGDFSLKQAHRLKDAGFAGVYHAVRMGEGRDTDIPVQRRLETFANVHEAGLFLGNCVEPVGPEHTTGELIEKTLIARAANPIFCGSARRILLPGTELATLGTVSKARMAQLIAVVRLAMPRSVFGNCTHEPDVYGAAAGASLLWAEAGSNPRDTKTETEGQHGMTTPDCRECLWEAGWNVLDGPSQWFARQEAYSQTV